MPVGLSNSQITNSFETGRAENKNVVGRPGKKYSNVSEYYAYLEKKFPCLSASGYKVTISPVYLEKCIKDLKCADILEKNLEHLPVSHQKMTAFWSANGAEVVNEQWNFDENGNCGGGTDMYVVSKGSSSGGSVRDKVSDKRTDRNSKLQEHCEKRRHLREQFEEKQAEKDRMMEQIAEDQIEKEQEHGRLMKSWYSESRMTQASAAYEANIIIEPI